MPDVVPPDEDASAGEAFALISSWQWGYYDPDGQFHAQRMSLKELVNRLAFSGHYEPKSATLTLLCQGKIEAIGRFQWSRFNGQESYRLAEDDAAILPLQWAKLRTAIAIREENCSPDGWFGGLVNLPNLGMKGAELAEWEPEFSRFAYALCPHDDAKENPDYFEEHFAAFELSILPLAVPGEEGQIASHAAQPNGERDKTEGSPKVQTRGRRPKYDWPAASLHIFGLINRGDFKPECQADIEQALIEHLTEGDDGPGESTVRPYAKLIWEENLKA